MKEAGGNLEFEKASLHRDQIFELRKQLKDKDMPGSRCGRNAPRLAWLETSWRAGP
jgi:hypothetical protein